MNSLLRPVFNAGQRNNGVFARQPLISRAIDLALVGPLLVLYGDQDWLRPPGNGADLFVEAARAAGVGAGVGGAQLSTTPGAGHHLYLDNAMHFNQAVNELHLAK